jgi:HAD superfamily phosphoserine phosphatase-like hydrolase
MHMPNGRKKMAESKRDVFICHTSEDKPNVARPLVDALEQANISYWFDEAEILLGDSITKKVNSGLRISQYVIVVLSTKLLSKNWPQRELFSALNIEASTQKVKVLPLLVAEIPGEKEKILEQLPLLNDKQYITWEGDPKIVVKNLLKRLSKSKKLTPQKPIKEKKSAPSRKIQLDSTPPPKKNPREGMKYKMIGFDLDGTLLRGIQFSWTPVWQYLKYSKKYQQIGMKKYRSGKTNYNQWCKWACNFFMEKNLKREDFREIVKDVTLTKNFDSTIRILKREGFILAIISGGIDVFIEEKIPNANELFDYIFVNKFQFDDLGRLCGVIPTEYDFSGKTKAIKKICREKGLKLQECVFVGEGFNDDDVISKVGLSIAYPPVSQEIREIADIRIEEDDLSLILPHVL